jgi:hypothetical protein
MNPSDLNTFSTESSVSGLSLQDHAQLVQLFHLLGVNSLTDAVQAVRTLQAAQSVQTPAPVAFPIPVAAHLAPAETGEPLAKQGTSDPQAALTRIRSFSDKVATLNGTIGSMEEQLQSLYSDRERLNQEIGASEVEDVVAVVRRLQATIASMETQLMSLYAGKELLAVELGRSDPQEIVAMFRNVSQLVNSARQELVTS